MSNFVLKYLNPVDYFGIYYENGVRPDGRAMDQYRSIRTNDDCFKSAAGCFGSSSVQLGDTAVTCGINYSIGTPDVLTPSLGEVRVNVTLGSIASSSVSFVTDTQVSARGMQKSDTEHELESFLQKVLTASNLVDVGALLIQECQYALRLEVNLVVLSNSGNLQDACVLAMVRALRGVVVPVVEVDVSLQETSAINTNVRLAEDQSPATPLLREGETLLSVTCGLLTQPAGKKDDATAEPKCHTLYDLTLEEQAIAEHVVTAVFRMSGGDSALVHISQTSKFNGCGADMSRSGALSSARLMDCVEASQQQAETLAAKLRLVR